MTTKDYVEIWKGIGGGILMKASPLIPRWMDKLGQVSTALTEIIGAIAGLVGLILMYHTITYYILKKKKLRDGDNELEE